MSGACPECMHAFQRWFVASVDAFARSGHAHNELVTVRISFQPNRDQGFFEIAPDAVKKLGDVTPALEGNPSTVKWMAGGMDFGLSNLLQKNIGMVWKPQLCAIASVSDLTLFRSLLQKQFPKSDLVTMPVRVEPCDGSLSSFSTAYSTEFFERLAYRRRSTRNGNTREFWSTRKLRLAEIDRSCLLVWLHEIGFMRRMYLWGVGMTTVDSVVTLISPEKS
jgi:hypothetical protein